MRARAAGSWRQAPAGSGRPARAEELMTVALALFAARDFAAVTIKDIARAAKVNTALIYYYFDNKEALFRATLEYAVNRALDNYRRLRERHADPVDLISDWFDTNVQLSEPIRQLVKIMLDYSSAHSQQAVMDRVIRRFYEEECNIIAGGIRRGIAQGVFRPVDAERAAAFASTHLDGVIVRSIIHRDFDLEAAMAELKSRLWAHLGYQPLRRSARRGARPRVAV